MKKFKPVGPSFFDEREIFKRAMESIPETKAKSSAQAASSRIPASADSWERLLEKIEPSLSGTPSLLRSISRALIAELPVRHIDTPQRAAMFVALVAEQSQGFTKSLIQEHHLNYCHLAGLEIEAARTISRDVHFQIKLLAAYWSHRKLNAHADNGAVVTSATGLYRDTRRFSDRLRRYKEVLAELMA